MSRIVQVANFVTPTSGGLRTTLDHLGAGYAAAGHEVIQIVPGSQDRLEETTWGARLFVAGVSLPGTGYRVIPNTRRVEDLLARMRPDVLEVHDRTTLRGLGGWARRHDVHSLVVSHERLDRWLRQWLPRHLPLRQMADHANLTLASGFDTVVCTTAWAAEEFIRLGVSNLYRVPLGVDLEQFTPRLHAGWQRDEARLVMVSRLSKEKRPEYAVETVRELCRRGVTVRLVVCGDGPMRSRLEQRAEGLPIEFRGFVADRTDLARVFCEADVALAPGPIETFGLAALEALACGTPVVVNRNSALPEVVGDAGRAAPSSPWCFADAVQDLLTVDETVRRQAARDRAELYRWDATVRGFLDVHEPVRVPLAS